MKKELCEYCWNSREIEILGLDDRIERVPCRSCYPPVKISSTGREHLSSRQAWAQVIAKIEEDFLNENVGRNQRNLKRPGQGPS